MLRDNFLVEYQGGFADEHTVNSHRFDYSASSALAAGLCGDHGSDETYSPKVGETPSFERDSLNALSQLSERFPMGAWMVSRTYGDEWIALSVVGSTYGIKPGATVRYQDTLCYLMVTADAPKLAGKVAEILPYRRQRINLSRTIGAYYGMPIEFPNGENFGSVCGIDPEEKRYGAKEITQSLEEASQLLGMSIKREQDRYDDSYRILAANAHLPGWDVPVLEGRDKWDELISLEEARCRSLGTSAVVMFVELASDTSRKVGLDAGRLQKVIAFTEEVLLCHLGNKGILVRIELGSYRALVRETFPADLTQLRSQVGNSLKILGISAKVVAGARQHDSTLAETERVLRLEDPAFEV